MNGQYDCPASDEDRGDVPVEQYHAAGPSRGVIELVELALTLPDDFDVPPSIEFGPQERQNPCPPEISPDHQHPQSQYYNECTFDRTNGTNYHNQNGSRMESINNVGVHQENQFGDRRMMQQEIRHHQRQNLQSGDGQQRRNPFRNPNERSFPHGNYQSDQSLPLYHQEDYLQSEVEQQQPDSRRVFNGKPFPHDAHQQYRNPHVNHHGNSFQAAEFHQQQQNFCQNRYGRPPLQRTHHQAPNMHMVQQRDEFQPGVGQQQNHLRSSHQSRLNQQEVHQQAQNQPMNHQEVLFQQNVPRQPQHNRWTHHDELDYVQQQQEQHNMYQEHLDGFLNQPQFPLESHQEADAFQDNVDGLHYQNNYNQKNITQHVEHQQEQFPSDFIHSEQLTVSTHQADFHQQNRHIAHKNQYQYYESEKEQLHGKNQKEEKNDLLIEKISINPENQSNFENSQEESFTQCIPEEQKSQNLLHSDGQLLIRGKRSYSDVFDDQQDFSCSDEKPSPNPNTAYSEADRQLHQQYIQRMCNQNGFQNDIPPNASYQDAAFIENQTAHGIPHAFMQKFENYPDAYEFGNYPLPQNDQSYQQPLEYKEFSQLQHFGAQPSGERIKRKYRKGKKRGKYYKEGKRKNQRKPQQSTPDDPIMNSPPSMGQTVGLNGYNSNGHIKEEPGHCGSPDSNVDSSDESRRRQKTCRVCGDHATGYNFNVITCESCKAFFRRNALRPKEFKCPYSEDCEINSVSRRFCQKCRLRKCFNVGMKKEWILNEEQLRRRKNSRLNNAPGGGKRAQHHHQPPLHQPSVQQQIPTVAAYQQQHQQQQQQQQRPPLTISSMENQMMQHMSANRPGTMQPMISPPGAQPYQLTSPVDSTSSDSPPSRNLSMMQSGDKSPDGYDPNVMSQNQRISPNVQPPNLQKPQFEGNDRVVLSAEQYKSLLARIPGNQDIPLPHPPMITDDEPTTKRQAYPCNMNNDTPPYAASMSEMTLSRNNSTSSGGSAAPQQYFDIASFGMGMATATGGGDAAEEMYRKMNLFCDTIIQSALDSPETGNQNMIDLGPLTKGDMYENEYPPSDARCNYQLNAAELKALDTVKDAFTGMDDQLEEGRQLRSFLKPNKTPADIMNIMDVTMRRFVKVAKCCPAFREITQEGKFSLLKGGMIEMLTIRGVTRYDAATNSFKTPTVKGVDVSVDVDEMFAKLNGDAQAQKEKCLEFFRFFDEEIKSNERAVHLVVLAVLFTVRSDPPMCDSDVRIVTTQRHHFLCLLNRYLESLYGEGARRVFERLPKALSMLNDIARNAGMLFMGTVQPGEAEELPREFFRIN